MLYWLCASTGCDPTDRQIEHAVRRNFGGLEELNTYEIFLKHLKNVPKTKADASNVSLIVRNNSDYYCL